MNFKKRIKLAITLKVRILFIYLLLHPYVIYKDNYENVQRTTQGQAAGSPNLK